MDVSTHSPRRQAGRQGRLTDELACICVHLTGVLFVSILIVKACALQGRPKEVHLAVLPGSVLLLLRLLLVCRRLGHVG